MHRTTELASQLIDGNLIDDNLLSPETETDNSQIKFIALSNAEKNLSETQQVILNATSLSCGHRRISGPRFSPPGWREATTGNTSVSVGQDATKRRNKEQRTNTEMGK